MILLDKLLIAFPVLNPPLLTIHPPPNTLMWSVLRKAISPTCLVQGLVQILISQDGRLISTSNQSLKLPSSSSPRVSLGHRGWDQWSLKWWKYHKIDPSVFFSVLVRRLSTWKQKEIIMGCEESQKREHCPQKDYAAISNRNINICYYSCQIFHTTFEIKQSDVEVQLLPYSWWNSSACTYAWPSLSIIVPQPLRGTRESLGKFTFLGDYCVSLKRIPKKIPCSLPRTHMVVACRVFYLIRQARF